MTAPRSDHDAPDPFTAPEPGSPLWRIARLAAGWVLIAVGAVTLPTPLPFGLPLLAIGLYLLARDSRAVRRIIRRQRRALPGLSRGLNGIKTRVPGGVRRMIEATDPTPRGQAQEE